MNININKNELKLAMKRALISSFVEDSINYKNVISTLNNELKEFKIDSKYTYDVFCIEFLNQSLDNLDNTDLFDVEKYDQLQENFKNFNLYNIQCVIDKKLDEVGLDREIFHKESSFFSE